MLLLRENETPGGPIRSSLFRSCFWGFVVSLSYPEISFWKSLVSPIMSERSLEQVRLTYVCNVDLVRDGVGKSWLDTGRPFVLRTGMDTTHFSLLSPYVYTDVLEKLPSSPSLLMELVPLVMANHRHILLHYKRAGVTFFFSFLFTLQRGLGRDIGAMLTEQRQV